MINFTNNRVTLITFKKSTLTMFSFKNPGQDLNLLWILLSTTSLNENLPHCQQSSQPYWKRCPQCLSKIKTGICYLGNTSYTCYRLFTPKGILICVHSHPHIVSKMSSKPTHIEHNMSYTGLRCNMCTLTGMDSIFQSSVMFFLQHVICCGAISTSLIFHSYLVKLQSAQQMHENEHALGFQFSEYGNQSNIRILLNLECIYPYLACNNYYLQSCETNMSLIRIFLLF